ENENENENERLIISVDDDGPGVPESELEQIFRPFYRVDEARARDSGGTGLGLAIVANAAKQHRGTVKAMKSPMGGLRVELSLPLWFE
ncbi:MAG: ATP-binding protein, partial [Actinobacillus minor]|nr:ATP-binding protein [Actinobacillus minor]